MTTQVKISLSITKIIFIRGQIEENRSWEKTGMRCKWVFFYNSFPTIVFNPIRNRSKRKWSYSSLYGNVCWLLLIYFHDCSKGKLRRESEPGAFCPILWNQLRTECLVWPHSETELRAAAVSHWVFWAKGVRGMSISSSRTNQESDIPINTKKEYRKCYNGRFWQLPDFITNQFLNIL